MFTIKKHNQQNEKATYRVGEKSTNYMSAKVLISRTCKEFPQFDNNKN